jgi:hypothetical protein
MAARRKKDETWRLAIGAYTPETMPMARLAEYAAALAAVMGESHSVHLKTIEEGSTVLVPVIEREAVPKVEARLALVRNDDNPPRDARDGYEKLNRLLREDNASAVLRRGHRGTKILEFPGINRAEEPYPTVRQHGTISGLLVRVGGTKEAVPLIVQADGKQIAGCQTTRDVAKRLATHLFEWVRLRGMGTWARNAAGDWEVKHFHVEGFDPLRRASLSSALNELRDIVGPVDADELLELARLRGEDDGSN